MLAAIDVQLGTVDVCTLLADQEVYRMRHLYEFNLALEPSD